MPTDQVVDGFVVAGEIVFAAGVALSNRQARIAGMLAVGSGFRERHIGAEEGDALVGRAGGWVAEIPSGIGGEGNGDLRQMNAGAVGAIGIDLREKDGEGCADDRRLDGENTGLLPVRAEVEMPGAVVVLRRVDIGDGGERELFAGDERAFGNMRIAAGGSMPSRTQAFMLAIMARQNQRMGRKLSMFWLASWPVPRSGGNRQEKCWRPVKK